MKKILGLILCLMLVVSVSGCARSGKVTTAPQKNIDEVTEEVVEEIKIPTLEVGKSYGNGDILYERSLGRITLNNDGSVETSNCVRDGGCIDGRGSYVIDGTTLTITLNETYMLFEWEKLPSPDIDTYTITDNNTFTDGNYTYKLED